MRKVGLFLLAVVLVAGFAGCGGGGGDDPTIAVVRLDMSCAGKVAVAAGGLLSVDSDWRSGVVSVHPGQQFEIELPQGGLYRAYFESRDYYWDWTQSCPDGVTTMFLMVCR